MAIQLPYAKSELYAMAKTKKRHQELIELVFDAKYKDVDVHTIEGERCMELMNARIEKSEKANPRSLGAIGMGIYRMCIIHEKYPILMHFNTDRSNVLIDITVPVKSPEGIIFRIHDLRDMLSCAKVDDMSMPSSRKGQCIPGTHYYI